MASGPTDNFDVVPIHVAVEDRGLAVSSAAGSRVLKGWGEALLSDGRLLSTRDGGSGLEWRVEARAEGSVEVWLALSNPGPEAMRVEQLRPLVCARGYRGVAAEDMLVAEMGWQSWSRPHPLQPYRPDAAVIDLVRDPITTDRLEGCQVLKLL